MMSDPEMLEQVREAMSDENTQRQMLEWAEKLKEQLDSNPQLQALAKQFENLDLGGDFASALEELQNNPQVQQMTEQIKAGLAGLGGEGDDADALENAINVGQEVFKKMLGDPEYLEQFGETMKKMLPPEALANMEEQIKAAMENGGMPDLAQLQQAMGGMGGMGGLKDEI